MKKTWFTITEVHPNIYAFAEFSHWELVVSYLLIDKTKAFLIDTGMGYSSIKDVIQGITSLPISVLLTHAHWDHIGSVNEFADVGVFADSFELKTLSSGFHSKDITELTQPTMFSNNFHPQQYSVSGRAPTKLLHDKEIIRSDTFNLHVIHTPGHTPGSVCFYIPQLKTLFTGDTLYPGPLYAQLPESDVRHYIQSIETLQHTLPSDLLIFPGHNDIIAHRNLLEDAGVTLHTLTEIPQSTWKAELKGKLMSILLR